MKKIFTLIVLAAALSMPAQAQVKFGLKGGLNLTNMSFSESVADKSNRAGFFIGPTVLVNIPVVGLGVDASALYDQREAKEGDGTLKAQQIAIPINLRYGFGLGTMACAFIVAGPQFGFNIGDKDHKLDNSATGELSGSNFSVNVGLGVMALNHLQVTANYNIVCGKTGEKTFANGVKSAIRGRSNAWQIGVAYFF